MGISKSLAIIKNNSGDYNVMKTKFFALTLSCMAVVAFTKAAQTHTVEKVTIKHSDAFNSSLKNYKGCDLKSLSNKLVSGDNIHKKSFAVKHINDPVAEYDFYAITEDSQLNADRIRGVACQFVMENKCRIFWGNILNMAFVADKPTASFPLDSTPHYMISPEITCDKMDFAEIKEKVAEKADKKTAKSTKSLVKEKVKEAKDKVTAKLKEEKAKWEKEHGSGMKLDLNM
ncbi:MAG: hypothetical protein CMM87_04410 [Rickettsiales bacterium]|nr:hypothetical protein [Rickettsiales bacterium]